MPLNEMPLILYDLMLLTLQKFLSALNMRPFSFKKKYVGFVANSGCSVVKCRCKLAGFRASFDNSL